MTCLLFVIIRSVNYRPPLCEAVFFLAFCVRHSYYLQKIDDVWSVYL